MGEHVAACLATFDGSRKGRQLEWTGAVAAFGRRMGAGHFHLFRDLVSRTRWGVFGVLYAGGAFEASGRVAG